MFVADSSVWVEMYRARWGREASLLREAARREEQVAICGPILQEVLQGFRDAATFHREWKALMSFRFIDANRWTFLRAASLFRFLRRKGATVN